MAGLSRGILRAAGSIDIDAYFFDTATDIDGTDSTAHTPDKDTAGLGYTYAVGSGFTVFSDRLEYTTLGSELVSTFGGGVDGYHSLSADTVMRYVDASNRVVQTLILNYIDNNNYIGIALSPDGAGGGNIQILEKLGGSFFGRGTTFLTAPLIGTNLQGVLSVQRDGANLITGTWAVGGSSASISYTTPNHSSATLSGIRCTSLGTLTPNLWFDNITST
jgi:hypothetical protein